MEDMRRLRGVLESNRKTYEFALFPRMPHGWMNSTMPGRYRPKETEQAWSMILDFMELVHAGEFPDDRVIWRFQSNIAPDYDFTKKVRLARDWPPGRWRLQPQMEDGIIRDKSQRTQIPIMFQI